MDARTHKPERSRNSEIASPPVLSISASIFGRDNFANSSPRSAMAVSLTAGTGSAFSAMTEAVATSCPDFSSPVTCTDAPALDTTFTGRAMKPLSLRTKT